MQEFSQSDAETLLTILASIVVPFVVAWLKSRHWHPVTSVIVALAVSVAGGILSQYIAGTLTNTSFITAALAVFVASQAHFATWFKGLGIEDYFNPKKPTEQQAEQQAPQA